MASRQERKFAFSFVERGKEFAEAKQYPKALEALREAVRRDSTMFEAWTLLASVHYALGEDIECVGATEEALKQQANNGAAWNYRGLALARLQRHEEALDAFAGTMMINGWFITGARNAFDLLLHIQRYDEAFGVADALVVEQMSNGRFWALRCAALLSLQRYKEACTSGSEAVRLAPDDGYAWFQYGMALSRLRRYDEALKASERVFQLQGLCAD
jgi:tetratricopeptide (TPR) repeat protein